MNVHIYQELQHFSAAEKRELGMALIGSSDCDSTNAPITAAQKRTFQELLAEVSRYGTATIKRAYGNWTTPQLQSWKEVLNKLATQPIQQFSYMTGKLRQTYMALSAPWASCWVTKACRASMA